MYSQAALVWGFQKIDARTWIEDGIVWEVGGQVVLSDDQAAKVAAYEKRIQEAGCFVMPD